MTKTRNLLNHSLLPKLVVFLLLFGSYQFAFAGKGNGKGKGGGSQEENNYAAKFTIDSSDPMDLLGDGKGSYIDQADGVEAFFWGTGNPTLRLQELSRSVTLDLSQPHCTPPPGADNATVAILSELVLQPNVTIYGVMTSGGSLVEPAFFGLDSGETGSSDLAVGFDDPYGDSWHWTIRFDPDFGGDQATITRRDSVTWEVSTLARKAVLLRKATKGRPHLEEAAVCDPLNLEYVVTCDLDGDEKCDLR